ncbi:hypothetical protein [Chryseobacterium taichungense]|nr:hypothetical protein [Chryseobacterium taichungense]
MERHIQFLRESGALDKEIRLLILISKIKMGSSSHPQKVLKFTP